MQNIVCNIERDLKDHGNMNGYTEIIKYTEFDMPFPIYVNVKSTE